MADLPDVEDALIALTATGLYPGGTAQPCSAKLADGTPIPCAIERGWPVQEQLQKDLKAGICVVSVYSLPGERNTSRYSAEWIDLGAVTPTIAAAINAAQTQITFSGAISVPVNVGAIVNGKAYAYAVQANDTLSTIASALAALINIDTAATSNGAVVTIAGGRSIEVHVGGVGTAIRELGRQERQFQITIWAPDQPRRDALAKFLDGFLRGAGQESPRHFLQLSDGLKARLRYVRTLPTDQGQLAALFRRDLVYSVDYATTEAIDAPAIVIFQANVAPADGALNSALGAGVTTYP